MDTQQEAACGGAESIAASTAVNEGADRGAGTSIPERIAALSKLQRIEYDRLRRTTADELGIRVETLDAEVASARLAVAGREDTGLIFEEPEPWPDSIDGGELLDRLRAELERYLVLPPYASTAIAVWALHTWCVEAFPISPILYLRSPEKRCGKTTLMILLREIVRRPLFATSASTATIFRSIEQFMPTLLLDEVDAWLRGNDELRGILNGGHSRKSARVLRTVGDNYDIKAFSTFCPKAIAGIGRLADTLEDRSVVIAMKRKHVGDRVEPLREDRVDLSDLRRMCLRWTREHLEALRIAEPRVPAGLNDRASDNWRALLAIADAAGGNWPTETRAAATALSCESEDEAVGVLLLADIRAFFEQRDTSTPATSAILVSYLRAMEERTWSEFRQDRPLTAPQLARLLRPFEIRPRTVRVGHQTAKGYHPEQFDDAFTRYLPGAHDAVTPSQSEEIRSDQETIPRNTPPAVFVTQSQTARGVTG
jgi:putative DNA primase/helicase